MSDVILTLQTAMIARNNKQLLKLSVVFAALTWFAPVNGFALGLGGLELHSALNQPLDADIEFLNPGTTDTQDVRVGLASREAFSQAGIYFSAFLIHLGFEVMHGPAGVPRIRITSDQPVREPFLDFLVEIKWPKGRLLREYTVLLDPPVLTEEKPTPIERPVAALPERGGRSLPSGARWTTSTQSASPRGGADDDQGHYGPVSNTDTLWGIAKRVRPDASVSIHQVMMALLKHNPEAFADNNVNNLRAGYVLRIPGKELMLAMSREEAEREARRQYQNWLSGGNGNVPHPPRSSQATTLTSRGPAAENTISSDEARAAQLKLLVPDVSRKKGASSLAEGADSSLTTDSKALASLRKDLALAMESSDVTRQENEELRKRLASLEEQLASMQRLVTLKDDMLATLQTTVEKVGEEGPVKKNNKTLTPGKPGVPADFPKKIPPPRTVPENPSPDMNGSAFGELLREPFILGGVAGFAVLLNALILVAARRRLAGGDSTTDITMDESVVASPGLEQPPVATQPNAAAYPDEQSAGTTPPEEEDDIDPLAEADVYLSYHRYDKAEELLTEAIRNEPERHEFTMKLLEVYAATGNTDGFIAYAERLSASLGQNKGSLWDKVVEMGKGIAPGHPLFGGSIEVPQGATSVEAAMGRVIEEVMVDSTETPDESHKDQASVVDASVDAAADNTIEFEFGLAPQPSVPENDDEALAMPEGPPAEGGGDIPDSSLEKDVDWLSDLGDELTDEAHSLDAILEETPDDHENMELSADSEMGTRLDLARAYIDMGDQESARSILDTVVQQGDEDQKREALELAQQLG